MNFNVLHKELQEGDIGAVNLTFSVNLEEAENATTGGLADGNQTVAIANFL